QTNLIPPNHLPFSRILLLLTYLYLNYLRQGAKLEENYPGRCPRLDARWIKSERQIKAGVSPTLRCSSRALKGWSLIFQKSGQVGPRAE
ncbi:hypothetical protein GIB67_016197, partial [Kingdonia uniflora]